MFDRERELAAIDDVLAAAAAGRGRLLVLEGPAGIGKSRLLRVARERAAAAGFGHLSARGDELERDFACGVALQFFGDALRSAGGGIREQLAASLPAPVAALFGLEPLAAEAEPVDEFALLHGLFMLAADLAEQGPLALLLDDAQWADTPSLRWLAYLAARFEDLPIALVIAHRSGERGEAAELIARLARRADAGVERLAPLRPQSVAAVVRTELAQEADEAFCAACASLTGGNPFYLHELLVTLRRDGVPVGELSPERLLAATPSSIARAVLARAGALPPGAVRLAHAVAILGSEVPLRHATALAGLGTAEALELMDALAAAEILADGEPLAFVHPLVAHAVASDLPLGARALLHLEAARLLAADGADVDRVAAHLLAAPARGDAWAVDQLRAAARRASARRGPDSAVRFLERALEEPPPAQMRAEVLVELGEAEAAAGAPRAAERLAEALEMTEAPLRRAEIQRARGHVLYQQGRHRAAAEAFDGGLAELGEPPLDAELASALQAGYVAAATIDPELRARALERADAVAAHGASAGTAGERAILAQAALHHCLAGEARERVRELALRAWSDGALLADETAAGLNWTLVTGALDFTDELELALGICEAAMADARRLGSPIAFATASYERAIPLYHMGRIAEATEDVQTALEAVDYGWQMYARSAAYTLALCQIELGELEQAEATLQVLDDEPPGSSIEHPALLDARGVLRLRQGRAAEALSDHLEAGRLFTEVFGVLTTGDVDWRLGAAEAALAGGDRDAAITLAEEGLAFSRSVGLPRGIVGALRVLGLARGGEEGVGLLREAVGQPAPAPARLEHLRALVDLGAALRRANRRREAAAHLRRARATATAHGALALAHRAELELRATGARPRSVMLSGVESLTPSEQRIARLAAQGATNRQIAQVLFVTPKTVEFHMRHIFQKLGISSRRELAPIFAEA